MDEIVFEPVSDETIARERTKARDLRRSQWWKTQIGRGNCRYCGEGFAPADLTMDHVVPVIRGGKSSRSNVVPCCKDCNNQKSHLVPVEWEAYLNRLASG